VAAAAVVVALVASAWPPLLYPLALLSAAMVVFLVAIVNSMVVLIVLRRDGRARHWREVALPLLLGLALALIELAAIGLARAFVVERWGLPLG
jgi:apolipoprotein N-acyltransferase